MNDISPKDYNFICVILGDNDFNSDMYSAMQDLQSRVDLKSLCPFSTKQFFIESMLYYYKIKYILKGNAIDAAKEKFMRDYFSEIRVLFNERLPTIDIEGEIPCDHDGGAIYVDLNTGFISSF